MPAQPRRSVKLRQPTGTLTIGLSADAESMDPYRVYQNAGFSVMYAIFDTLVTIAPDGSLGPGLANSWTSPDAKTLELKLHPGVKFQDGEPFDAAAVRFSLYRIADIDPATSTPYPVGDSTASTRPSPRTSPRWRASRSSIP